MFKKDQKKEMIRRQGNKRLRDAKVKSKKRIKYEKMNSYVNNGERDVRITETLIK